MLIFYVDTCTHMNAERESLVCSEPVIFLLRSWEPGVCRGGGSDNFAVIVLLLRPRGFLAYLGVVLAIPRVQGARSPLRRSSCCS